MSFQILNLKGVQRSHGFQNRPLQIACLDKNVEFVSLLLNHPSMTKSCINKGNINGMSALQCACINGNSFKKFEPKFYEKLVMMIVELLINDKRCNVNKKNSNGETALFIAIKTFANVAIMLIDNKRVNVNIQSNMTGDTPLHVAVLKYMFPNGNIKDEQQNRLKVIQKLLSRSDLNLNIKNNNGKTALNLIPPSANQLIDIFASYDQSIAISMCSDGDRDSKKLKK